MAVYKLFSEKDATILSQYPAQNTGRDEILELLEEKDSSKEIYYPSRFLIKFKNTEIKDVIENKLTGAAKEVNTTNLEVCLEVFSTEHKALHANHIIQVHAISQSWDEGTGRFKNNPSSSNGCTWEMRTDTGSSARAIWATSSFAANSTGSSCDFMISGGGTWWTGTLDRTTWIDREVYDNPVASDYLPTTTANTETILGLTDGATQLFLHETGNNGDGAAITAFVKSGVVQIGEGNDFSFVSKLIPDIEDQEGVLNAKLEFKNYPNNSVSVTKTVSFEDDTDFVSLRGRGREFTVNVVSNTTGTAWRLGTQRFDIQPDGRR